MYRAIRHGDRDHAPQYARYLVSRALPMRDLREIFGDGADLTRCQATVDALYRDTPPGSGDLDRIQSVMTKTFLTENLLSFSDGAAMAWSAEMRMPFLDRDLVEFVLTRSPSLRTRASLRLGDTKRILRRWARGRVPEDVIHRKKRGFQSGNITNLLRADRSGICARILDLGELRSAMPGLERWLSHDITYYKGTREGTLWALLTLAVWRGSGLDPIT